MWRSPFLTPALLEIIPAAGNAGSAITQALFFTSGSLSEQEGYRWMGVMILGMTTLVSTIHFPMVRDSPLGIPHVGWAQAKGGRAGRTCLAGCPPAVSRGGRQDPNLWPACCRLPLACLPCPPLPQWGGMFTRGNPNKTEEEYYASDYTVEEREQGLHRAIMNWVSRDYDQP